MSRQLISVAAALLMLTAAPALAEVKSATPGGFEVGGTVAIEAPPARVWAVLTAPDAWWSRDHRWFKASTLSLDLSPGGCWCERAADGRVSRHLETVLVEPGSKLVLQGGLGPRLVQAVDMIDQLALRHDAAGPMHQIDQHLQLARRQLNGFLAALDRAGDRIEHDVATPHDGR